MIFYSKVLDPRAWSPNSYPIGAFCVIMIDENRDIILDDMPVDPGYSRQVIGNVYRINEDGELVKYGQCLVDPEYLYTGRVYANFDDLVIADERPEDPEIERILRSIDQQVEENEIVHQLWTAHRTRQWQMMVIIAAVVLTIGILAVAYELGVRLPVPSWWPF
jgi:hypothetical protein